MEPDKKRLKIALIAPTQAESKDLRLQIQPEPHEEPKIISQGELHGKSIIFSHCGVGKVNAAHTATLILENYDVDLLLLFGIAGTYSGAIGDVVVAESENYGEEGVLTEDGWKPMEFTGFPLLKNEKEYYNTFPMDADLVRFTISVSKDTGFNVKSGNFVTVSQCSGTHESGEILKKRFNSLCENMEGAAVAHICALYGMPMIEIRGISNIVEERALKNWNIPLAVSHCNKAVSEVVKRLK
ncbi:MAG: futalosine hydrolase [Candidatus Methanoperedens sp.]|nr:futalosine hydrolase [Candidatus Methanoperedens sp.]